MAQHNQSVLTAPTTSTSTHGCLVLLGMDGAGKTTAATALTEQLRAAGYAAVQRANPAGRRWLERHLDGRRTLLPVRWQDAIETPIRALNAVFTWLLAGFFPGWVVSDRHLFCQLVLRRVRGLADGPWLEAAARGVLGSARVVVLDVDPFVALARVRARGEDEETLSYLMASRLEYLRLAKAYGWPVIDAEADPAVVLERLRELMGT